MRQGAIETATLYVRKFGYSIQGATPQCHRLFINGARISVVAVMASDRMVAWEYTRSNMDSEHFFNFIRGLLIPQMHPFDGSSSKSVLIMDNCSIHHVPEVASLLRSVVIFLPQYSPDYNPIEELFSYIKTFLRRNDSLIQSLNDPTIILKEAFNSVKTSHCNNWVTHAGYN